MEYEIPLSTAPKAYKSTWVCERTPASWNKAPWWHPSAPSNPWLPLGLPLDSENPEKAPQNPQYRLPTVPWDTERE